MKHLVTSSTHRCLATILAGIVSWQSCLADDNVGPSDLLAVPFEDLIETKVSSVSRKEETAREASSSIYVLTRERIRNAGVRTLRELVRLIPGVQAINNTDESLIALRGIFADNGSKLLIMIDGHEVNRVQDQGMSGEASNWFIDKIDRVEVIRGPGGVIYGSSAFSGTINIITRQGAALDGADFQVQSGSYDQHKIQFQSGKMLTEDLEYYLFLGAARSSGDFSRISGDEFTPEFPNQNPIEGLQGWGGEIYSKINFKELQVKTRYFDNTFDFPARDDFKVKYRSGFSELKVDSIDLGNNFKFIPRAYWDGIEIHRLPYRAGESRLGTELRMLHEDKAQGHSFVAGVEYRYDSFGHLPWSGRPASDRYAGNITSTPDLRFSELSFDNLGVYAQEDYFLTRWMKGTAGIRFDDRTRADSYLSPRLGIVLLPDERDTIKLLFQGASRPLSAENIGPNAAKDYSPNLSNERIQSFELIWNHQREKNSFETGLWYNKVRDMTVIRLNDPDRPAQFGLPDLPLFSFTNGADSDLFGTDLEWRFSHDRVFGSINHAILLDADVRDTDLNMIQITTNGDDINGYSDNISNIDINFVLTEDISLNSNLTLDWGKHGARRRRGVLPEAAEIPIDELRRGDWDVDSTGTLTWLNLTLKIEEPLEVSNTEIRTIFHNVLDERSPDYNNSGYFERAWIGRAGFLEFLIRF